MATRFWNPNAIALPQITTYTVTATPIGGTIGITINGKTVFYTCVTGDTVSTAAANLQALLLPTGNPPPPSEFADIVWTVFGSVITGTAATVGTPYTTAVATTGGAVMTQTTTQVNSSPSDVNNALNWLDGSGLTGLPANGDDVTISNSSIGLLWNVDSLNAILLNSLSIWQNFTGNIGLPEINQTGGYIEYRSTYFRIKISSVVVGIGAGSGSGLMRLNVESTVTSFDILNTGAAGSGTPYALRLLGTNAGNTLRISGGTVGVAMLAGEVSNFSGGVTLDGGSVAIGSGVTLSGTLQVNDGASAEVRCVPTTMQTIGGSLLVFAPTFGTPATYATLTIQAGSTCQWVGPGVISTLNVTQASTFQKLDPAALTITNGTISNDSRIEDPYSSQTYTNAIAVTGPITTGLITAGTGKHILIS